MSERRRRFQGAALAATAFAFTGLLVQSAVLLLAAAIPLVAIAVGSFSTVDDPDSLTVERVVEPTTAPPGYPVAVTLTVTNDGERTLSDVRIVDAVPRDLAVTGGSPRAGETLEPGDSVEIRYALMSRRGEYRFDAPTVKLRGLAGGAVAEVTPAVAGDTRFTGALDAHAPPIDNSGDGRVGQLTADKPGEGLTFHSTREYKHGDTANRIDWRHYAKQGELTTVNYERRVSATVVLVLDAREPNRVVAGPGRPTGLDLSAYAATQTLSDLLAAGHDVAVAVVGLDGPHVDGLHWLPPSSGAEQRSRAKQLFVQACESEPTAADPQQQFRRVLDLAPETAQLALISPLLDPMGVTATETWRATDRPTVVLSPDVLTTNTVSGQLSQVRRRTRLARCQRAGARTIDWRRGTPLAMVVERAFAVDAKLGGTA